MAPEVSVVVSGGRWTRHGVGPGAMPASRHERQWRNSNIISVKCALTGFAGSEGEGLAFIALKKNS